MIESTRSSPGRSRSTHSFASLDDTAGGPSSAAAAPVSVRQHTVAPAAIKTRLAAIIVFGVIAITVEVHTIHQKAQSGSGWESNPPNAGVRRFADFEDRGSHQSC